MIDYVYISGREFSLSFVFFSFCFCIVLPVCTSRSTGMSWIRISWRNSIFRYWWCSIFGRKTLVNRCSIVLRNSCSWCTVFETWMAAFGFRTVVSAHLNHTLEVNVHTIWEFESLEVGEANYWCTGTKILNLLEPETKVFVKILQWIQFISILFNSNNNSFLS